MPRKYAQDDILIDLQPGDYDRNPIDGNTWYICTPTGLYGSLRQHTVEEHEDGSISVTSSISIRTRTEYWHGYLTKGVWTQLPS